MHIKLNESGSVFSTRSRGVRLLANLEIELAPDRLVVDLDGVQHISYSFADEFIGKLVQRAIELQAPLPEFVNIEPGVRKVIALNLRARHLPAGALAEVSEQSLPGAQMLGVERPASIDRHL
jgi:hypothetical protein